MAAARRAILLAAFDCWQSRVALGYEHKFACPSCDTQSQLRLWLALTTVQCLECSEVFDVQLPSVQYDESSDAIDVDVLETLMAPAFRTWRSRRRDRPVSRASTLSMSDAVVQHAAREAVPPKLAHCGPGRVFAPRLHATWRET